MIQVIIIILAAIITYILQLQPILFVTATVAILIFIFSQLPEYNINIEIKRSNKTTHNIIIKNQGPFKLKNITYRFHGKMIISDMPSQLEPNQTIEFGIGLSLDSGRLLDVEVSYLPSFGLKRKVQHIQIEAKG